VFFEIESLDFVQRREHHFWSVDCEHWIFTPSGPQTRHGLLYLGSVSATTMKIPNVLINPDSEAANLATISV
jgi:hypothetical protein